MGREFQPEEFQLSEMYAYVASAVEALHLSGPSKVSIEDRLYVNGQEIRGDQRFLDHQLLRPRSYADPSLVKEFMENSTENVRHYKCFRVQSWRGELVLSIFLRFKKAGKNLFIETDYVLLSPLKEEYYQIDTEQSALTPTKLWRLARQSFLPTFSLLLRSPIRVFTWAFREQLAQTRNERVGQFIQNNQAFDFGTSTSLREVASSSEYRRFFQRLDKEMYVKIIERQILESIADFLTEKNIDTTDLREREAAIFNNGIIVNGGSFQGSSLAAGQDAQASSTTFTSAKQTEAAKK